MKFGFKPDKTATASFQMIKQAYGDNVLPRTRVCEWCARFRDGRGNLGDDECSGRTTPVGTTDMIEILRKLISTNRRMILRLMEEGLEIGIETIREFLVGDLRQRKLCARFVPHEWAEGSQTASLSRVHSICASLNSNG
jgi:hypothetical protein